MLAPNKSCKYRQLRIIADRFGFVVSQLAVLLGLGIGLTVGTVIGGIPALASLPFAFIPPASRLIAKCTCDLILTLSAAFTRKGRFVTKQDFQESLGQYCVSRTGLGIDGASSVRALVHKEIDRLIPIHTVKVYEPLSTSRMRAEFQRIIARHRFTLDKDFTPTYDEEKEEADVAEDVHGLNQWVDQREQSPSIDHGSSATHSPDLAWSETPNITPSHSPPNLHAMKSMEHVMYQNNNNNNNSNHNADPKVMHHQPVHVAELPGTLVHDPWNGGVAELPAPMARNAWHTGIPELP